MEVLILGAICLYCVFACLWVVWKGSGEDDAMIDKGPVHNSSVTLG